MKPTDNMKPADKIIKRTLILFTLIGMILFSLAGCVTVPENIPAEMTALEFFHKAQEAVSARNDYKTALFYYETFLERFPADPRRAEALYEIGFIYYKTGQYAAAEEYFNSLIQLYKAPGADKLPRWPYTLAEKLLTSIEEK